LSWNGLFRSLQLFPNMTARRFIRCPSAPIFVLLFLRLFWAAPAWSQDLVEFAPLGQTYIRGRAAALDIAGDYAYVLTGFGDVDVIDIRDPSAPAIAGSWAERKTGHYFSRSLVVSKGYAYLLTANVFRGLAVLSLADPVRPSLVTTVDGFRNDYELTVVGDFLIVSGKSTEVLDISLPGNPQHLFKVEGAFAGLGNGQLFVRAMRENRIVLESYSLADPPNPRRLAQLDPTLPLEPPGREPMFLTLSWPGTVRVVDVADPNAPKMIFSQAASLRFANRQVEGGGLLIQFERGWNFGGGRFGEGWDTTDLRNPVRLGVKAFPGLGVSVAALRLRDGIVYVGDSGSSHGLRTFRALVTGMGRQVGKVEFVYPRDRTQVGYSEKSVPLRATSSGGLPVRFRVASGPGVLVGDRVQFTGTGVINIVAESVGDAIWFAAAVTNRVIVSPNTRLKWQTPEPGVWPLNTPYAESAVSSEGIPARLRVASGPAEFSEGRLVITNFGLVTVMAELNTPEWAAEPLSRTYNPVDVSYRHLGMLTNRSSNPALVVAVDGDLVFVSEGTNGVRLVSLADPSHPRTAGRIPTLGAAAAMSFDGTRAFIAEGKAGVEIFDRGSAAGPERLALVETPGPASAVRVVGKHLFVADGGDGFAIFDVSDPRAPRRLGGAATAGPVANLQVAGDRLYVAERHRGLSIHSLTDLANPRIIGRFEPTESDSDGLPVEGFSQQVELQGNLAYVSDWPVGVRIVDVSDPLVPREVGRIVAPKKVSRIAINGTRLSVALGNDGVEVWNVSAPGSPMKVDSYDTGDSARDVVAWGDRWLVADRAGGLLIFEESEGGLSFVAGSGAAEHAGKIQVEGKVAYLANGLAGLKILDVADPANPVVVGELDTPGNTVALHVVGGRAYLADDTGGLQVADVSNPAAPVALGHYRGAGPIASVAVRETAAWLAAGPGGMETVDVSDPRRPRRLARFTTPGSISSLAMEGQWVVARDTGVGLLRFHANAPTNLVTDLVGQTQWLGEVVMGGGWVAAMPVTRDQFMPFSRADSLGVPVPPLGGQETLVTLTALEIGSAHLFMGGAGLFAISEIRTNSSGPSTISFFNFGSSNVVRGLTVKENDVFLALGERGIRTLRIDRQIRRLAQTISSSTTLPFRPDVVPVPVEASSGLPVTAEILSGPGTLEAGGLRLSAAGTLRLRLTQAGSERYRPVTNVAKIEILPNQQIVMTSHPASVLEPGIPHPIRAEASSGLPVTFRVLQGPAEIREGALWITNLGPVVWTAEQAGSAEFSALAVTNIVNASISMKLESVASARVEGSANRLRVRGDFAYVTTEGGRLFIFDIRDPGSPRQVGQVLLGSVAEEVDFSGDVAVVVTRFRRLITIDIRDPANPLKLAELELPWFAQSVRIRDRFAMVTVGQLGLVMVDIGDPTAPRKVAQFDTGGIAEAIRFSGNIGAVANGSDMLVADFTDPQHPRELSRVAAGPTSNFWNVEWAGNYLYVATPLHGVHVFDVSDPTVPRRVRQLLQGTIRSVRVVGQVAYFVSTSSLMAFDVSQPENPVPKTVELPFLLFPMDVDVSGSAIWVTTQGRGLESIRASVKVEDQLNFAVPQTIAANASPLALATHAASGLPVSWSWVSGPVRIEEGRLIPTGFGAAVIRAETKGTNWVRPVREDISFSVVLASQVLSLNIEPGPISLVRPRRIRATSNSGLPVTLQSLNNLAEIRDGYLWPSASGQFQLEGRQDGNETFDRAATNWQVNVVLAPEAGVRMVPLSVTMSPGTNAAGRTCEFTPFELDDDAGGRNWSGMELATLPGNNSVWVCRVRHGGLPNRVLFQSPNLAAAMASGEALDASLPLRAYGESVATSTNAAGVLRLVRGVGQVAGVYAVTLGGDEFTGRWSAEVWKGVLGYNRKTGVGAWELQPESLTPGNAPWTATTPFTVPGAGSLLVAGNPDDSGAVVGIAPASLRWDPSIQRLTGDFQVGVTSAGGAPTWRAKFRAELWAPADEDRDQIPDLCDDEFTVGIIAKGRSIKTWANGGANDSFEAYLPVVAPAGVLVRLEWSNDLKNWIPFQYLRGPGSDRWTSVYAAGSGAGAARYWRAVPEP